MTIFTPNISPLCYERRLHCDLEQVPILGIGSNTSACYFVASLNDIYELDLTCRGSRILPIQKELANVISKRKLPPMPTEIEVCFYEYFDPQRKLFYIFVQLPKMEPQQTELFSTDPVFAYDKLLFIEGETAFERMTQICYELDNPDKWPKLDVCDYRAQERQAKLKELVGKKICTKEMFDFRPPQGEADPMVDGIKLVTKKKKKCTEPVINDSQPLRVFDHPMANLGQYLLWKMDEILREDTLCKEGSLNFVGSPNRKKLLFLQK
ncbi:MAG: hypothetical protein HUK17_06625 [Bacteroidales bacterium]|nr:hypothetical protein [Bacteroidales bacterium]